MIPKRAVKKKKPGLTPRERETDFFYSPALLR